MFTGFPTNSIVLILTTMIAATAAAWYALAQGVKRTAVTQRRSQAILWAAAILLAALFFTRLALTIISANATGALSSSLNNGGARNFAIALITIGLMAGLLPLIASPYFRQVVHAIPENWLVGIHAIRVVDGFAFLALADMKLLPTAFALPAGYGDVATGLMAIGLVFLLTARKSYARPLAIAWSAFGLLDLVNAEVSGFILNTSFLTHLAASGVPLGYFQYVLIIPSFIVPIMVTLHIYFLYHLLSVPVARTRKVQNPVKEPA